MASPKGESYDHRLGMPPDRLKPPPNIHPSDASIVGNCTIGVTGKRSVIMPLLPRLLAPVIREALKDTPVVCVIGPRQSGKTTLVQHLAPDRAFFSLDENNYYQTAVLDPSGFVAALPDATTVDEVQRGPNIATGHQARRGPGPSSRSLPANRFGQSVAAADGHRVAGRTHGDRAVAAVDGSGKRRASAAGS